MLLLAIGRSSAMIPRTASRRESNGTERDGPLSAVLRVVPNNSPPSTISLVVPILPMLNQSPSLRTNTSRLQNNQYHSRCKNNQHRSRSNCLEPAYVKHHVVAYCTCVDCMWSAGHVPPNQAAPSRACSINLG